MRQDSQQMESEHIFAIFIIIVMIPRENVSDAQPLEGRAHTRLADVSTSTRV